MNVVYKNTGVGVVNPNICPHCHVTHNPNELWHTVTTDIDNTATVVSAWQCTNQSCRRAFIAKYRHDGQAFRFERFLNGLPKGPEWPKPISDLKSGNPQNTQQPEQTKFIKTYLQSLVAESNGLDELAGMGYRKAIEYLVKDWAIQLVPADKDKIEKSWLGAVINDYYTGDLKDILERATWLGNDQAHYNQLFTDFDINVLKELIELIMVELDRQYKMKHYIDNIQKRK